MSPNKQNGPRVESNGPSQVESEFTADSTPCDHLAKAAHWLRIAESNWTDSGPTCQNAAKLAELHIMLADRVGDLEACGE